MAVAFVVGAAAVEKKDRGILFSEKFDDLPTTGDLP